MSNPDICLSSYCYMKCTGIQKTRGVKSVINIDARLVQSVLYCHLCTSNADKAGTVVVQ